MTPMWGRLSLRKHSVRTPWHASGVSSTESLVELNLWSILTSCKVRLRAGHTIQLLLEAARGMSSLG